MRRKSRILLLIIGSVFLLVFALGQSHVKTVIIEAIEDSYVVTDLADAEDISGIRGQNFGALEFLKTWYAFGVLEDERLLSIDLIKFDLGALKGLEIESAFVQFFARQVNLTELARLVDVHLVRDPWSEADVTYDTRPAWDPVPIATSAIYGAGGWYSWNVTGSVISAVRTGEISFAAALRTAVEEAEEQVVFVSKDALDKAPRLMVTYEPGSSGLDWWWWIVVGGGAVALSGGTFYAGRFLRRRAVTA